MKVVTKKVVWRDKGLKAVVANVNKAARTKVEAGLVGDSASAPHGESGLTVAEVGLINEYGTKAQGGYIPERAFQRSTVNRQFGKIVIAAREAATSIVAKRDTVNEALGKVGQLIADEIKKTILDSPAYFEGNADATIDKKGFDHPLIEGGTLYEAVTYRLVKSDGSASGPNGSGPDGAVEE